MANIIQAAGLPFKSTHIKGLFFDQRCFFFSSVFSFLSSLAQMCFQVCTLCRCVQEVPKHGRDHCSPIDNAPCRVSFCYFVYEIFYLIYKHCELFNHRVILLWMGNLFSLFSHWKRLEVNFERLLCENQGRLLFIWVHTWLTGINLDLWKTKIIYIYKKTKIHDLTHCVYRHGILLSVMYRYSIISDHYSLCSE